MHILVIPSWYTTPENPQRGSFFRSEALALRKAGHRVGLLVPPSKARTRHGLREMRQYWRTGSAAQISSDHNLLLYRLLWWGWLPMLYPPARVAPLLRLFDRYCAEQGKPDVIHAHSALYGGWLAAHLRRLRGVPAVLTEHSSALIRGLLFPDQVMRLRTALRDADRVLAVSDALAQSVQRYVPGLAVEPVVNAIDTDFFTRPAAPLPAQPFAFTLIANLNANKCVDLLLRAFAEAFRGQTSVLRIAGDGPERAKLEALAHALGIQAQVEFLGRQPRAGVRDLLWRSHTLVSSSRVETFGVTLIEALACGLPVVATRSGGPQAIVHAGNGLLTPVDDTSALAAALRQMRDGYARYDADAIRADCVARYSEAAVVRQLETIYHEVTR